MAQELENLKGSCCKNKSTRIVTFDCGNNDFETYLVCDIHYQDEGWSRCATKVVELRQ